MTTIKSYTDIEQSKKLAEILPFESADMYYYTVNGALYKTPNIIESGDDLYVDEKSIPCWSLAALLKVLPEIRGSKPIIALAYNYITYPHISGLHTEAINPVDACVAMIEKLHELNLL